MPAKAGPFNLGTVVVHAIIQIDKSTSAITITSDPVPQSIDGVPFRVKQIAVRVDRPEFMFNPTNCEAGAGHEVTASLTGNAQGQAGETDASASASTPLTATGCASLPVQPALHRRIRRQILETHRGEADGQGDGPARRSEHPQSRTAAARSAPVAA